MIIGKTFEERKKSRQAYFAYLKDNRVKIFRIKQDLIDGRMAFLTIFWAEYNIGYDGNEYYQKSNRVKLFLNKDDDEPAALYIKDLEYL